MTSSRVANELAAIMVPIGVIGAVLAGLCAIIAAVAIVRGAGGLVGGAVGLWIPSAMLSSVAGFASQWLPLLLSGVALVGLLVIGAVVRSIMKASGHEWVPRSERAADAVAEAAPAATAAPATSSVPTLARPKTAGVA